MADIILPVPADVRRETFALPRLCKLAAEFEARARATVIVSWRTDGTVRLLIKDAEGGLKHDREFVTATAAVRFVEELLRGA